MFTNTTGAQCVAIGRNALYENTTGNYNVAIGYEALQENTTASENTAVGYQALEENTTGLQNVALGFRALEANTTADHNTALGHQTLQVNTTGTQNTAVGANSLDSVTTGDNNTAIGYDAGDTTTTGSNNTSIGYNAEPSSTTVSNEITLGNTSNDNLRCNDTSISSLSDRRDKTDIVDLPVGLDFINTLQPRKFKWETRDGNIKDGKIRAGFIAQELQSAQEDYKYLDLVMENNPERLEAKQEHLVPVLVQAIKELSAQNEALVARITALESN